MSNQQQPTAWQTASRARHSHSASRTPQNRSNTASPNPQNNTPPQAPPARQDSGRPQQQQINNVWTSRSSSAGGSNGPARSDAAAPSGHEDSYTPTNGFNAAEVKAFLSRETAPAGYKVVDAGGQGKGSGGAWGAKANHMANNQPFFVQLAKQIVTMEGGG